MDKTRRERSDRPGIVTRFLLLAIALAVSGLVLFDPAMAQQGGRSVPQSEWDQTAVRAQQALQSGLASSDAFEVLRAELARQRAEADSIVNAANISIRLIRAQLLTLGPAPAKDAPEPDVIAARRQNLTDQLTAAETPVIDARQASARANVLIEEIDRLVRIRSATSLFERRPSPLLPSSWMAAKTDMTRFLERIATETRQQMALRMPGESYVRVHLVPAVTLALLGIVFPLLLGHLLVNRIEARTIGASGAPRVIARVAGLHFLRLVLSTAGATLLLSAFFHLEIGVTTAESLGGAVTMVAIMFVLANWIGHVLFAPENPTLRLVHLGDRVARASYRLCLAFAAALTLEVLVEAINTDFAFSPAGFAVVEGVSILVGCLVILGLSRVVRAISREQQAEAPVTQGPDDDEHPLGAHFFVLVGGLLQGLAIVALIAAAIGFVPLAQGMLVPIMGTLALICLLYILHHAMMVPLNVALEESRSALVSMAVATMLALVAVPLFAMIWGARFDDVSETWRYIEGGIDLGGVQLSPKVLAVLAVTFVFGLLVTRWMQRIVDRVVLPRTRIDRGGRIAIRTGLGYIGIIVSALFAIATAGLDLSNLAIIAGALSVGVGFGMQAIVSNFVSGVILLIERPIKEGDWIEVSGFAGIVRKIAVRSTRIETFDRHDVIIPNADLIAGTVKNMTFGSAMGRMILPIGIGYGSDIDKAKAIMLQAAAEHSSVLHLPEPQVLFMRFGTNALEFELRCFLADVGTELKTRSDLLFRLHGDFQAAGIEIPFTQSDVTVRNLDEILEALLGARKSSDQAEKPSGQEH